MANHLGKEGVLNASSLTVAEVRGYSLSITTDEVEDTVIGDNWKTRRTTIKDWKVSGDLFWDETDAGQGALTIGSTVTIALYPEGLATSSTYYRGLANITSFDVTARHDSLVEATFSASGTGTLSTLTV